MKTKRIPPGFAATNGNQVVAGSSLNAMALTPQMILALVRRRLDATDNQITQVMDSIEQGAEQAERFAAQQSLILALRKKVSGEHGGKPAEDFSLRELIDEGSDNMITIGGESKTLHDWMESVGLGREGIGIGEQSGRLSIDSLSDSIEQIKINARTAASGNEMLMLQLQQLMQQRSQVIQLGTNLSKKIADGENAIIGNLR